MFQESLQNVFISENIDIASLTFYYSWVSAGLWKPSWNQYLCPNQVFLPKLEECNSWNRRDAISNTKDVSLCRRYWDQKNTSCSLADYRRRPSESGVLYSPSTSSLTAATISLIDLKETGSTGPTREASSWMFLSWALRKRERKNNQTRADQYFLTFTHSPSRGEERIRFIAADTIHQNPSRSEVLLGTTLLKRML